MVEQRNPEQGQREQDEVERDAGNGHGCVSTILLGERRDYRR
jgi:hypothetical protein